MTRIVKITKTVLNIGLFYIFAGNVNAKCSKEDVDYYLEKGFTTEQVAAMCSEEIISSIDLKNDVYKTFSDEYADEQDEEYVKKNAHRKASFFEISYRCPKSQN